MWSWGPSSRAWSCAGGPLATSHALEDKLDAVGYGSSSRCSSSPRAWVLISTHRGRTARLVAFFLLLLVVRGLPSLFLYRRDLERRQRVQMMLLTATSLPLLVALAAVGLSAVTCCRRTPLPWSAPASSR